MQLRLAVLTLIALMLFATTGCGKGDNESRGEATQLQSSLDKSEQRNATLEQDKKSLEEEGRRVQAKLAAATGGKGLSIEDQQRALDDRKAGLDTLQKRLTERDVAITQRETKLDRDAQDFYHKTNTSMEDIGEARQIKREYENMRSSRDAAVADSGRSAKTIVWMMFALVALLIVSALLIYRMFSSNASQKRELSHRRDMARVLQDTISPHLPPERSVAAMNTLKKLSDVNGREPNGVNGRKT